MWYGLTRFPVHWIVEKGLDGVVVKGVWLLVPLEYYVLTRLDGGSSASAYLPAMAVGFVAAVFASSAVIALVYPPGLSGYEQRLRCWSLATIVTWGAMLVLLSLSYFFGSCMGQSRDVIENLVCSRWTCPDAAGFRWSAIVIDFIWAIIAIAAIILASWRWSGPRVDPQADAVNPNIFVVAGCNAVLMAILHGATLYKIS
jgi:hypothetical protein